MVNSEEGVIRFEKHNFGQLEPKQRPQIQESTFLEDVLCGVSTGFHLCKAFFLPIKWRLNKKSSYFPFVVFTLFVF